MTARVIVGLGGNIGDRRATLDSAAAALADLPGTALVRRSAIYETHPVGPSTEPFLNAAVELDTTLTPHELLAALLRIEREHGRVRNERWAARTLDLDILVWLDEAAAPCTIDAPGLTIPHPRLAERDFALAPLVDLLPSTAFGGPATAAELLAQVPQSARTVLGKSTW